MTNLEWLLAGDLTIVRLVRKYLLDEETSYEDKGYMAEYCKRYDPKTKTWGNGFYGPKWISTNYTLLDLKYLEIDPMLPIYQESITNYLNHFWKKYIDVNGIESMDLCIGGMFVELLSYGLIQDDRLFAIIDYILEYKMEDGAWNCLWRHASKPQISSVHTTINVLEGLLEYVNNGYTYKVDEVIQSMNQAITTLLERNLVMKKGTNTPIHSDMIRHHFPPRWKADYLRMLEFFASATIPYHPGIEPALEVLYQQLKKGRLSKGTTISGLIHFPLELEKYGRFNTFRAYKILKYYNKKLFHTLLNEKVIQ